MRAVNFFILALFFTCSSICTSITAQQNKISIQSTLKDISGKAIPDGDVSVTFRLYHQMDQGQAQWSENATVSVVGGIYSHKLGSVNQLPAAIFGNTLYLGVTVAGGPELAPRTELTSAPYAVSVGSLAANGGSASFEGGGLFSISGSAKTVGNLGIATSAIPYHVSVGGNHGLHRYSDKLSLINGGMERMQMFDNGNTSFDVGNQKEISFWVNNGQKFRVENGGTVTSGYHAVYGDLTVTNNGNFNMSGSGSINMGGGNLNVPNGNLNVSSGNGTASDRWITFGDSDTGLKWTSDGKFHLVTNGNEGLSVRSMPNGYTRVGINSGDGSNVPLWVGTSGGSQDVTSNNYVGFSHFNPNLLNHENNNYQLLGNAGNVSDVVAHFDGATVATQGIWSAVNLSYSDKRVKHIIGQSNSGKDMALVNKIKITDYTMIDQIKDNKLYKKVIAQELLDVYPQSVTKSRSLIPNIFVPSTKTEFKDSLLTITIDKAHELSKGDHIDILGAERKLSNIQVFEIVDDKTFTVKTEKYLSNIFVYGKYVDDFLSVDYDALAMLNISATQELYKRLVDLELENKALKTTTANLEDRMGKIEAMLSVSPTDVEETKTLAKK